MPTRSAERLTVLLVALMAALRLATACLLCRPIHKERTPTPVAKINTTSLTHYISAALIMLTALAELIAKLEAAGQETK